MQSTSSLDALPLWGLLMAILLLVLLSIEGGYRLGQYRRRRSEEEKEAPVGAMVGATLGLLAFILAFTFGLAAARFDTRRQVLLDEANAIGTTYLRAGMFPDRRDAIRALRRDYVDTRLEAVRSGQVTEGVLVKRGQSKLPAFGTLGTFGVCHIPGPLQTAGWPLSSQTQSLVSAMCLSTPRS
jgi:hypothetical protein